MPDNQNRPREFDAVLGGQEPPPVAGVILGGLFGVEYRLTSPVIEARIAALCEALNYGKAGLNLIIQALPDSSQQVQRFASRLLREKGGSKGKQALLDYDPWLFFTTLQDWTKDESYSQNSIFKSLGTAHTVTKKYQLQYLLQNLQGKNLEALVCETTDNHGNRHEDFQHFANLLVDKHEKLPNLKALFIGDTYDSEKWTNACSQIYLYNISSILKAFPKLEVLHLCGRICDANSPLLNDHRDIEFLQIRNRDGSLVKWKKPKHNKLKTLIIEGPYWKDNHLSQICEIEYPSLEYLELWLGRQNTEKIVESLAPVLSGKSCPNLLYLGLIGSANTNAIARAITQSPIIERLKVLDLTNGNLNYAGARALLECSAVNRLHTLKVSKNQLHERMIQRLIGLNCQVITDSRFHDRYYSVWE